MCEFSCDNLIDLSLDDEISCSNTKKNNLRCEQLSTGSVQLLPAPSDNDANIENDPFDCVQKMAGSLNDPFDSLEEYAWIQDKQVSKEITEIKLGNLLSLNDDVLLDNKKNLVNPGFGAINIQESPAVAFNGKSALDGMRRTGSDTTANSAEASSTMLKKNMKPRKKLLINNIINVAVSSPTDRKQKKESEDIFVTPLSSVLSKAAAFGENLISTESPLKWLEDEGITSEEPQSFEHLENKFDADLEMLKIPILNKLSSPVTEKTLKYSAEDNVASENYIPNLESIKSKLNAKKLEINTSKQQEISTLIQNLKTLLSRDVVENKSKKQASDLLDSLTFALNRTNRDEPTESSDILTITPHPITRQGTFDLDLQEKEANEEEHHSIEEIPSCLVSSSATYDSETPMQKEEFKLPEISPLSPQNSSPHCNSNNMMADINDIVEQLSRLLINNAANSHTISNNPTFIVVMNANQINNSNIDNCNHDTVGSKLRSSLAANYLDNSVKEGSPDIKKENYLYRPRSQSLSIHDKIKVVQLPLHPNILRPTQKQQRIQNNATPATITTPPSYGNETLEFKTPRLRRNSFSNGTPYTAKVALRRTGFGTNTKNFSQMQKFQTLDTHHEGQQQAIVKPLQNLPTFKIDLKKKLKSDTESIIKASGPLKATIPVKKLAPMLKLSPPSSEKNFKSKIVVTPPTPKPNKGAYKLSEGVGYPNACSTPAAFISPLKRVTATVKKPRYSYMSVTPNSKTSVTNSSIGNLKRRTSADFKEKSPLKSRIRNADLHSTAASLATLNSRLSVSTEAQTSKAPVKTAAKTVASKSTGRLGSRLSVGGSLLTNKNKENKRV